MRIELLSMNDFGERVKPGTGFGRKVVAGVLSTCALFVLSHRADAQTEPKGGGGGEALRPGSPQVERIAAQVYKQIVTLPQYGVFDQLHFAIKGDSTVILRGEASRPVLKSSAENVAKKIEGVREVINEIEVLPLSPNDDRIRALTYIAIYRNNWLRRYTNNRGGPRAYSPIRATTGITNDPPVGWHAIHIIVKNGNIRLVGVVDTAGDLAMAEMQARSVPGAFAVENDLMVAKDEKK
jgi:hyperosmotically inducible periplasmic protein